MKQLQNLNGRLLVFFALLLCSLMGFAQKRSESEALEIARSFMVKQQKDPKALKSVPLNKVVQKAKQQAVDVPNLETRKNGDGLYIISDPKNKSFVLVSGDERMKDVLGYSFESDFDAESIAPGLLDLMDCYQRAFDLVQLMHYPVADKAVTRSVSAIDPLIKTKWGQNSPYNDLCPTLLDLGEIKLNCASGCVATAMAQVLNYYKYPTQATGYISYQTRQGAKISSSLSSIPLDWDNMVIDYKGNNDASQREAVSRLLIACGYSVYMEYYLESSAYSENIAYALINNFGYNPNLKLKKSDYYSIEEWEELIDCELEQSRPILYSGQGSGGHQFVLDGRNEIGQYHFNFGWDGDYDGFYSLNPLSPGKYDFSLKQDMVIGISPDECGTPEDIYYSLNFSFDNLKIKVGDDARFSTTPICYASCAQTSTITGSAKFDGQVGIGLFDKDFNFIKSLDSKSVYWISNTNGSYYSSGYKGNVYCSSLNFEEGSKKYLAPYVQSKKGTITRIRTTGGLEDWYLATTKDGVVTLTLKGEIPDNPEDSVEPVKPVELQSGFYNALAYDETEGKKDWQITISKDKDDETKYWIGGLDPIVSSKGYTYDKGWNKVYGVLNNTGTRLTIPANQSIADDIIIKGLGDSDDIVFVVSANQNVLSISEPWGSSKNDGTVLSKYSDATFVFTIDEEKIAKPLIVLNEKNKTVSITSSTESARIFYTLDGKTPTTSSALYQKDIVLEHNCTVSAVAEKNGKVSEVTKLLVEPFVVARPVISKTEEGKISIACSTDGATIYYTSDGTEPSGKSSIYVEPFTLTQATTIKAFAYKDDYKNSPVSEFTYFPPVPDNPDEPDPSGRSRVVKENVAGKLSERIEASAKLKIEKLTVSGNLNGDDIRYIREMLADGKLSTVNIADANIVSGGGAYYDSGIVSYKTEDGVVGAFMFDGFRNLISLRLPNSATRIDMFAVSDNDNLLELSLPSSCQKIKDLGLSYNKRLPSVTLPASLKDFSAQAFSRCSLLASINVDSNNTSYTSQDGVLFSRDMKRLIWYSSCRNEDSYTIPSTVTVLGEECFNDAKLQTVVLPDGVETIESSAFNGCKKLSSVEFPASLREIGMFAFENCNLASIDLNMVSELKAFAFAYNPNLTRAHLGTKVKKIDDAAFTGCKQLKSFDVDEDNIYFSSEDGILFNKDFTELCMFPVAKTNTFYVIPESVNIVGENAFSECYNLEQVILGKAVKEIGASAFSGSKCKYIKMESDSKIEKLGMFSFQECDSLRTLVIPDEVSVIPSFCVAYNESLEYLKLPSSLTRIDSYAFLDCHKLATIESVVADISNVQVEYSYSNESPFEGIKADCLWIVPEGTETAYKSCPWWVDTWRIKATPAGIKHIESDDVEVHSAPGYVTITSPSDSSVRIYSINGQLCSVAKCVANIPTRVKLPAGLYVINGHKYVVGN